MSKIDFKAVAAAALTSLDTLLGEWLPGGRRDGHEYKALNPTRADRKEGSFSINLNTGAWGDFADGEDAKGGDAISLYAYINGVTQLEAAKEISERLGLTVPDSNSAPRKAPKQPSKPVEIQEVEKPRSDWSPIIPVPDDAPAPPVAHMRRGRPDMSWTYRTIDGGLVGYIWRCKTSDGGKEILPLTYCKHSVTGAYEWRWLSFPDPRPLYVPGEWREGITKLVVEGEKCADVAHEQLADYDAVAWPGGGNAVDKADWSRFKEGDKVLLWPDCDAQRVKLSKEEKEAGVLPESKPILPEEKQPGIKAMEKVAQKLIAQGCKVRIVAIPAPGEKPDGWDIADAVQKDDQSAEEVEAFIKANQRAPGARVEKSISTATGADAKDWSDHLFWKDGRLRECRENVYMILQHHPDWKGVLWRDEFSNRIVLRRDSPIGKKAGEEWLEEDDFKLGLWIAKTQGLFLKANSMLAEAIRAESDESKFHPVRDYLEELVWDKTPRLGDWLSDFIGVTKTEYTALVGRYFLIGMVSRVMKPGEKMDSALILEGLQGAGKSTVAKILAGGDQWFSDTVFVMGDKDSFQALRGRWVYELAELDAFGKAESTRAKAFISSSTDSYRAPYDRTFKDHPRQCVFIGTTNQYEYFKDSSGNRRYWPVKSDGEVNLDGLRGARDQLFAEALELYRMGKKNGGAWFPTPEEQTRLFTPEQEERELADPWMTAISQWLSSHTQSEVSSLEILTSALKVELSKIDGARQMTTRVGICMRKLGWGKDRKTTGTREYVYTRPKKEGSDEPVPF